MLERLLAKRHINSLDLSSVREKVIEKIGWSSSQAENIELEYRRFLYALARKGRDEIISPPSQEVDEFWHQHILDTRAYLQDCNTIFGHYMHHTPRLEPEEQAKADALRRKVYAQHNIDSTRFGSGDGVSSGFYPESDGAGDSHHAHGVHPSDGGDHSQGCDGSGHDGGGGHGSGEGSGGDAGCGDGGGSGGDGGGGGCGGG